MSNNVIRWDMFIDGVFVNTYSTEIDFNMVSDDLEYSSKTFEESIHEEIQIQLENMLSYNPMTEGMDRLKQDYKNWRNKDNPNNTWSKDECLILADLKLREVEISPETYNLVPLSKETYERVAQLLTKEQVIDLLKRDAPKFLEFYET